MLTAPRVHQISAFYYRQSGLDEDVFKLSHAVITKALQANMSLTRDELKELLHKSGIIKDGLALGYVIIHAELDGLICSGPRRGKQFTYMLLEERAPKTNIIERDEALGELVKRFFTSHGPAQIQDFVWWSGLTTLDTKRGIDICKPKLSSEVIHDKTYWFHPGHVEKMNSRIYLLPNYDEYTIAYKDRSDFYDPTENKYLDARRNAIFNHSIIAMGRGIGTWRRTFTKKSIVIETNLFRSLSHSETKELNQAAQEYGKYLHVSVAIK
jgi:hypothetical protein